MKMNTYQLIGGPNRDALIQALTQHQIVYFRCKEEKTGKNHRFDVRITGLGLIETEVGAKDAQWTTRGLIVSKDGGPHQKDHLEYRSNYFPAMRSGMFYELPDIEEGSYEYFDAMSESGLADYIRATKLIIPKELSYLERYSKKLDPRERLILEAIHTHQLRKACLPSEITHRLGRVVKEKQNANLRR